MVHRQLVSVAGCVFTIAIVMGGGGAGAADMRLASLSAPAVASSRSSDEAQVGNAAADDLGSAPAGRADLQALESGKPAPDAKRGHKQSAKKHGACVHGEWISETDFNPFTLSCTDVGF